MTKNNEKLKKLYYAVGENCGRISKLFTAGAIITFVVGLVCELNWDRMERKELKNKQTN